MGHFKIKHLLNECTSLVKTECFTRQLHSVYPYIVEMWAPGEMPINVENNYKINNFAIPHNYFYWNNAVLTYNLQYIQAVKLHLELLAWAMYGYWQ